MIRRGDIDLQREIRLESDAAVADWSAGSHETVRRTFSAKVPGLSPHTVCQSARVLPTSHTNVAWLVGKFELPGSIPASQITGDLFSIFHRNTRNWPVFGQYGGLCFSLDLCVSRDSKNFGRCPCDPITPATRHYLTATVPDPGPCHEVVFA
ncbi:hypothetical protein FB45DRAFT_242575 [Roridomyces roridus]|uniref:Uncharacterized protein n=1 Tax=Roridomyces roridus TaxID=1738132 RepID=A0AAD7BB15_9AGAR|nr:hypothetical protein FB45DRAFT_242575 [Roridomyces roridus]